MLSPESSSYSFAEAYVTKSIEQKLFLNLFSRVRGTEIPSKIFEDEKEALLWLKSIKK